MKHKLSKADLIRAINVSANELDIEDLERIHNFINDLKERKRKGEVTNNADIMGHEKRIYKRLNVNVPITYKRINRAEMRKRVVTQDISGGGTRLIAFFEDKIQVGDMLELQIFLPTISEPIKAEGKVVWIRDYQDSIRRGYEVGIEYYAISNADRVAIAKFIHQDNKKINFGG